MTRREKACAIMEGWARAGVRETPFGSNWGGLVSTMLRFIGLGPNPWCDAGFTYAMHLAGVVLPIRSGLVSATYNSCANLGWCFRRGQRVPARGDGIVFEWDGYLGRGDYLDHIGVVRFVDGSRVHTVECNSGNAVSFREYSLNDGRIYGYIRVPDPKSAHPNPPRARFPLPVLLERGGLWVVRLGRNGRVIGHGSKRAMTRLWREKTLYWTNRNRRGR